jgi:hypothetical protein
MFGALGRAEGGCRERPIHEPPYHPLPPARGVLHGYNNENFLNVCMQNPAHSSALWVTI